MTGSLKYSKHVLIKSVKGNNGSKAILVEDSLRRYYIEYDKRVYLAFEDKGYNAWLTKEEALELCKQILTILDMQGEL